ncbi:hypothetical protein [Peptostreptococcus canis]|uniref:YqbQ/XkdQ domain-containing protein n=1 Tax=Peptostreptococcus canis TaxID=1159213 RepID=A0ABR6TMF0_9FIRM|nr:hypothetical protein [Peptostreptococcus canis]MBC2576583.1 hypothetical protein [Peptostreptococcus canis]MBP1998770.1 hypothetical protein [Peptostreptococcus canis]
MQNNVILRVYIQGGKYWDITNLVPYVRITGNVDSVSRTLETELFQSVVDSQIEQIGIKEGSSVCFYVDGGKEIYRGNIVDISKEENGVFKIIAKDVGFILGTAKFNKNFVNKTPEQVAKEIIKECRLNINSIAKTNIKLTRYFRDTSAYDIIMTFYTLASRQNKKKYMMDINLRSINIIERGKALTIGFDSDSNITNAEYGINIEELVNTVSVVDKNGNKISQHVNKELTKVFHLLKNKILEVDDKSKVNKDIINNEFYGADKTCSLTGYGNYNCRSGYKVHIKEPQTGLIGEFYIDEDSHEWNSGGYICNLSLNFKNIMDEKESGSETLEQNDDNNETSTVGTSGGMGLLLKCLIKY